MVCIYQNGPYLYGKPVGQSNSVMVYGNLNNTSNFYNGDIIRGGYQTDQYGNIKPVGTWKKIGETYRIEPEEIPIEEISANMIYQYVCFNLVELTQQSDSYMTIDDGTEILTLFNRFDVQIEDAIEPTVTPDITVVSSLIDRILSGKPQLHGKSYYYVEGFVEIYRNQVELVPTCIRVQSETRSDDFNNDGEVNIADVNALINMILGLY